MVSWKLHGLNIYLFLTIKCTFFIDKYDNHTDFITQENIVYSLISLTFYM